MSLIQDDEMIEAFTPAVRQSHSYFIYRSSFLPPKANIR
jgi:hypothetical protein